MWSSSPTCPRYPMLPLFTWATGRVWVLHSSTHKQRNQLVHIGVKSVHVFGYRYSVFTFGQCCGAGAKIMEKGEPELEPKKKK